MIGIVSPLAGWVTPLDEVPDPVFAERMLGDGIAIDPVEGRLLAPASGIIENLHESAHALTLSTDEGPVLLMHIGLDTVALGGNGFSPQVKVGQRVSEGDPLILFDLDLLARSALSIVTPIIITNGDAYRIATCAAEGPIKGGERLLLLERADGGAISETKAQPRVSRSLRLLLAHGLHARPAARLAKAIAGFDCEADIVAEDGRSASARSPVAMLGLGLRHGAEILVRAGGVDAERAVAALTELLESGMGELRPLSQVKPAAAAAKPGTVPGELHGIVAVPGLAIGPAWRLRQDEIGVVEEASDQAVERAALAAARDEVKRQLEIETRGNDPAAAIAEAHLAMIDDPLLEATADRLVSSGKTAAFAWREAIHQAAAPLRASNDPRFSERLDDLLDLERRLLRALAGETLGESKPPAGSIVVAETLYPSQLKALAEDGIAGVVTAAGGATSHAAIIAAGLGLPMAVALGDQLELVEDGTPVVLRGDTLMIAPGLALLEKMRKEGQSRAARLAEARIHAHELATTADGTRIEVFANLGSVAEAALAVDGGADGCGLLRTEFLFLDREVPPDEAEQRQAYQAVADALGDRPLIIRTLDIGADKPAPWLAIEREDNPALGLRGIRLQLARKELLETQLRALLGVRTEGKLKIMLPMISNLSELRETKSILARLAADMRVDQPETGIMVETPAAALLAPTLAKEAAFFSIGSNDLSQYALARDRTNPAVACGLDGVNPAVLRLIDETVRGADASGRTTSVCGGLAAIPEAIPILIGLGVTELSVPAGAIAEVKSIVRRLDLPRCRELAHEAIMAPEADVVRALVMPLLEQDV